MEEDLRKVWNTRTAERERERYVTWKVKGERR